MSNALVIALLASVLAVGCKSDHQKCVDRGVAYYKEIGSYPRLSNGDLAEYIASERCRRSNNVAFPEPER